MAKVSSEVKESIKTLSREELEKLVLKAASSDKFFYDYLIVNYVDKESGEQYLYDLATDDLNFLFYKGYKGYAEPLRMANMLSACIKRINEFAKVCKNKNLEADLILYVLEIPFGATGEFSTCFTAFDYKVGLLVQRLITLVTKKMHEDFLNDYKAKINEYLDRLHRTSNHLDFIHAMPAQIG